MRYAVSFENRGRHSKKNAPKKGRVKFEKAPPLTTKGEMLRVQWEKMNAAQKAKWDTRFDIFRNAHEHTKTKGK